MMNSVFENRRVTSLMIFAALIWAQNAQAHGTGADHAHVGGLVLSAVPPAVWLALAGIVGVIILVSMKQFSRRTTKKGPSS